MIGLTEDVLFTLIHVRSKCISCYYTIFNIELYSKIIVNWF